MKVLNVLKKLVETPSPYFHEEKIADKLEDILRKMGFQITRQPVQRKADEIGDPNFGKVLTHFNILGVKGKGDRSFLLYGHMDTVHPREFWTDRGYDTFKLKIRKDNPDIAEGLGVVDMKGGITAILLAAEKIIPMGYKLKIVFGVDEENISQGGFVLKTSGFLKDVVGCIVPEPSTTYPVDFGSLPAIMLGRRGRIKAKITVQGKSAHAANPELGVNAITESFKFLNIIQNKSLFPIESLKLKDSNGDIFVINGSICPLEIHSVPGGLTVPEKAVVYIDRHFAFKDRDPNEVEKFGFEQFQKVCDTLNKDSWKTNPQKTGAYFFVENPKSIGERPSDYLMPFFVNPEHILVKIIDKHFKEIWKVEKVRHIYGNSVADENYFGSIGIPTIVLGPVGSNWHQAFEWVSLKSIEKLSVILEGVISEYMNHC